MKTSTKLALLGSVALGVAAWTLVAQDTGDRPPDGDRPPRRTEGPQGPGRDGQRPMLPLLGALDANHDGVIDADEIKNASAVLLKLDKNGDGKLTRDEFIGRPPGRQDGPPPGGPSDRPDGRKDARFDDSGPPRDGRDFGPPGGGREFGDRGPGQRGPAPSADAILEKFDTNKDGKLDKTELAVFLKDLQSRRPPPLAGGPRPGGPPREDGPPR